MSAIAAASLYCGLNILILMALALRVVQMRQKHKVSLGDGGVEELQRACRVHANATEYAPAAMAGLVALALAGGPAWAVHAGGLVFTAGRLGHAWGFSGNSGVSKGRMFGTLATWIAFVWIGIACIAAAF